MHFFDGSLIVLSSYLDLLVIWHNCFANGAILGFSHGSEIEMINLSFSRNYELSYLNKYSNDISIISTLARHSKVVSTLL